MSVSLALIPLALTLRAVMGKDKFQNWAESVQVTGLETDSIQSFPTNFRDGAILTRTLKEFGVNPIQGVNGTITCTVQGTHLTFRQHGDAPFSVEMENPPSLQEIFMYLSDVDDEYKRCVQALVYEKLKQRAAEQNLAIETEEVLDDNSIVITLTIQK